MERQAVNLEDIREKVRKLGPRVADELPELRELEEWLDWIFAEEDLEKRAERVWKVRDVLGDVSKRLDQVIAKLEERA